MQWGNFSIAKGGALRINFPEVHFCILGEESYGEKNGWINLFKMVVRGWVKNKKRAEKQS